MKWILIDTVPNARGFSSSISAAGQPASMSAARLADELLQSDCLNATQIPIACEGIFEKGNGPRQGRYCRFWQKTGIIGFLGRIGEV